LIVASLMLAISYILLFINIIGLRRIGRWKGHIVKKIVYGFTLFILAIFINAAIARVLGNDLMWTKPVPFILIYTIITHSYLKRSARLWIELNINPMSFEAMEYPEEKAKDWETGDKSERLIIIGVFLLAFIYSGTLPQFVYKVNPILLVTLGLLPIIYGNYLKFYKPKGEKESTPRNIFFGYLFLIGFSFSSIGLSASFYYYNGVFFFWLGLAFILLSYLNKKKKLYLPATILLIIDKIAGGNKTE